MRNGIDRHFLAELPPAGGGMVDIPDKTPARQLGVKNEIVPVSDGHDQARALFGNGAAKPDLAMVSTGTAEVAEVAMTYLVLNESLHKGNISIGRHAVPGP